MLFCNCLYDGAGGADRRLCGIDRGHDICLGAGIQTKGSGDSWHLACGQHQAETQQCVIPDHHQADCENKLSAREFGMKVILDVLETTGITATAGIGTNLYLAKIAMDIGAKQTPADKNGVRIAELDEMSYRRLLWSHRPLTDFWRVGKGYAAKLEQNGLYTMGDIARCSLGKPSDFHNEDLLYKLFGINAELLIDHAWGWEPCTIADIKAYRPSTKSLGSGQVLHTPYSFDKARLIVREMTELLVLDLVEQELVADQMVLTVGYDRENLTKPEIRKTYQGAVTADSYGRMIPKPAHGSINLQNTPHPQSGLCQR